MSARQISGFAASHGATTVATEDAQKDDKRVDLFKITCNGTVDDPVDERVYAALHVLGIGGKGKGKLNYRRSAKTLMAIAAITVGVAPTEDVQVLSDYVSTSVGMPMDAVLKAARQAALKELKAARQAALAAQADAQEAQAGSD